MLLSWIERSLEELWINEPDRVFVAREGRHELTSVILTATQVRELVERMLSTSGRRLDVSQPFVDAMLPGGHRLHVVLDGIARGFSAVNVRKFVARAHSLEDLVELGTIDAAVARFLRASVVAGLNVVVSGGTQAGKTTLLNCLAAAIPGSQRLITVEEVFELQCGRHPDWVALQCRQAGLEGTGEVTLRMLVKEALRMRPSRVVVGEVRSAEVLTRPDRLVRFLDAATQSMTVDDDLASTRALGRLAQRVRSVDPARITFMAMPTAAAPQDPNRVVATDDARTVFSAIDADEPVRLASDRPAPSPKHAPIEVLNGARVPGLAASAAGQLESLGHTVVAVGDAQEPAERTILVVDGSDRAKRTAAAVARSFGLDVEPQVDPDVAGVRLVLGASDATGLQVRDTPAVETTSRHADEDLCS